MGAEVTCYPDRSHAVPCRRACPIPRGRRSHLQTISRRAIATRCQCLPCCSPSPTVPESGTTQSRSSFRVIGSARGPASERARSTRRRSRLVPPRQLLLQSSRTGCLLQLRSTGSTCNQTQAHSHSRRRESRSPRIAAPQGTSAPTHSNISDAHVLVRMSSRPLAAARVGSHAICPVSL